MSSSACGVSRARLSERDRPRSFLQLFSWRCCTIFIIVLNSHLFRVVGPVIRWDVDSMFRRTWRSNVAWKTEAAIRKNVNLIFVAHGPGLVGNHTKDHTHNPRAERLEQC